jgi:hypothetical protein
VRAELVATKVTRTMAYLDLDLGKALAVVNTDNATDHFGDNKHVAKMGLDSVGLLSDSDVLALKRRKRQWHK